MNMGNCYRKLLRRQFLSQPPITFLWYTFKLPIHIHTINLRNCLEILWEFSVVEVQALTHPWMLWGMVCSAQTTSTSVESCASIYYWSARVCNAHYRQCFKQKSRLWAKFGQGEGGGECCWLTDFLSQSLYVPACSWATHGRACLVMGCLWFCVEALVMTLPVQNTCIFFM